MQSKPVSEAAEVAMVLRAETGFGPILDAALTAGRVVIDDRTTSITMSPPNRLVAPLTRRSGGMARRRGTAPPWSRCPAGSPTGSPGSSPPTDPGHPPPHNPPP